jgi:hypothetical protein
MRCRFRCGRKSSMPLQRTRYKRNQAPAESGRNREDSPRHVASASSRLVLEQPPGTPIQWVAGNQDSERDQTVARITERNADDKH